MTARVAPLVAGAQERLPVVAARLGPVALRAALAAIFVWFGALKVAGVSPVGPLLAALFSWLPAGPMVATLGVAEVLLGTALMLWRSSIWPPLLLIGHLTGTFLTFLLVPQRMFHDANVFQITMEGEFVAKNVILISGLLILLGTREPREGLSGRDAAKTMTAVS